MTELRDLVEHPSGQIECEIKIGEEWHPHSFYPADYPDRMEAYSDQIQWLTSQVKDDYALNEAKTNAKSEIDFWCGTNITGHFVHEALGSDHTYPSNKDGQLNLQTAAASYQDRQIMCMDNAASEWAMRTHTQAQAQEILEFNANRIETLRTYAQSLKSQIDSCNTVGEVNQIIYESPT